MLLTTDSLVGCEERSFDSSAAADSLPEKLGAGRINIPVGCEERSFVAMLLRTDSLVGGREVLSTRCTRSGYASSSDA
jgi:hypothetical protein